MLDLRFEKLFDRIFELLSSTQPPETASGATLVQCLAQLNHPKLIQFISNDRTKHFDQIFFLIDHITQRLDQEVHQAKLNLFQATKTGPMYGCLSGINALLKLMQGDKLVDGILIDGEIVLFDLDMKMKRKFNNGEIYSII